MRQLACTSVRVDRWDYYITVISKLDKRVAGVDWLRSDAVTIKDAGPRAEPWMTLARISTNSEVVPINLLVNLSNFTKKLRRVNVKRYSSPEQVISELRGIICRYVIP